MINKLLTNGHNTIIHVLDTYFDYCYIILVFITTSSKHVDIVLMLNIFIIILCTFKNFQNCINSFN